MTATVAAVRRSVPGWPVIGVGALGLTAVTYAAAQPSQLRLAVAIVAVLAGAAIGLAWPERLLYGVVIWLVALGLVRRLLELATPDATVDPLLLVEPAAIALLVLLTIGRARPPASGLSASVAATALILAASSLNPAQGGLATGAAGLAFVVFPLAAFQLGRTFTDAVYARVLALVAALAVPVALYGLVQLFVGFPRWDRDWILRVERGYQALNVGPAVRSFASLPSSAEYAYVLAIGLAIWLAFGLRSLRLPLTAAVVALLGAALILASSRFVVFLTAAALIAMLVARAQLRAPVAAALVLAGILATSLLSARVAPEVYPTGQAGALLAHQTEGLANPLDPRSSTFLIHLSLVTDGLHYAHTYPLGIGAGAVSLAATKFGGVGLQTEADPSNLAVAAGLPGLVAYVVLAAIALTRAYGLARARKDALSLGALAIVVIVFLQWFNGGQYGVALLLWLSLGWIDRADAAWRAGERP